MPDVFGEVVLPVVGYNKWFYSLFVLAAEETQAVVGGGNVGIATEGEAYKTVGQYFLHGAEEVGAECRGAEPVGGFRYGNAATDRLPVGVVEGDGGGGDGLQHGLDDANDVILIIVSKNTELGDAYSGSFYGYVLLQAVVRCYGGIAVESVFYTVFAVYFGVFQ